MKFDYIPCRVLDVFLSAIYNDDRTALTDEEEAQLDQFEARIHAAAKRAGAIGPGHWAHDPDYSEEEETGDYGFSWAGDDVAGLAGNIAHLAYMFPIAE